MRHHFRDPSKSEGYKPKQYVPKPVQKKEYDYDEEIENFILKMNSVDPFSKVLIEGIDLVEKHQVNQPKNLVINLPSPKDSNIDENENEVVQVNDKSSNGSKDTNSNEENSEDGTSEKKDTSVANEEKYNMGRDDACK